MVEDDPKDEKIFELNQEIIRLRCQITYLQEELAVAEGEIWRLQAAIDLI